MAYDYAAARQAGVSDSDIIAALADRHNYDLKAARKSRVADGDILGALLERENSGAISQELLAPDRSLSIPRGFTEGVAQNQNLDKPTPAPATSNRYLNDLVEQRPELANHPWVQQNIAGQQAMDQAQFDARVDGHTYADRGVLSSALSSLWRQGLTAQGLGINAAKAVLPKDLAEGAIGQEMAFVKGQQDQMNEIHGMNKQLRESTTGKILSGAEQAPANVAGLVAMGGWGYPVFAGVSTYGEYKWQGEETIKRAEQQLQRPLTDEEKSILRDRYSGLEAGLGGATEAVFEKLDTMFGVFSKIMPKQGRKAAVRALADVLKDPAKIQPLVNTAVDSLKGLGWEAASEGLLQSGPQAAIGRDLDIQTEKDLGIKLGDGTAGQAYLKGAEEGALAAVGMWGVGAPLSVPAEYSDQKLKKQVSTIINDPNAPVPVKLQAIQLVHDRVGKINKAEADQWADQIIKDITGHKVKAAETTAAPPQGAGSETTGTHETGAQGAGQPVPGGPAAGLAPQDDYELQQALQTSAPTVGPGAVAADLPGAEPVTAPMTTPVPAEPVGTLAKAAQAINPYAQLAGQPFANAPTEQPAMPSMPAAARGLTVNTLQAPSEVDLAQEWAQREIANPATTGNERKNLQFMLNDRNPQKLELVRYWRSFTNQAKPVAGRGLFDAKQPLAAPTVARDSVPLSPTVSAATAVPVAAGQQTPEPAAAATSSAVVGDGVAVGIKHGAIGIQLAAGERVLTASGRTTTPFPKINMATNRTATNTLKRVDQWLIDNAIDEARSRGDKFNQRQFAANRDKPSQADKDGAELYLFGDKQPDVVPSILKPLAPEGAAPVSQNTPVATIDQDQKTAQAQPGVAAPENDGAKTTETAIVEEGGTDNAETEVLTTNAGSDREAGREESGKYLQDAARYARGVHGSVRAFERQEYPQPGQVELKGEQKEVFDAIKAAEVDVLEQLMEQRGAFPSAGFVAAWKAQGSKGETEHKVALAPDHKTIRKFGTAAANHTWADYLDRISHHNQLFPKTPYTFLGFSEIGGQLHAVIDQPYIFGDHIIKAPVEVIDQHLLGLGLKPYVRPQYAGKPTEVSAMARLWIDPVSRVAVWDVRPANVLYDTTVKTAHFIDPIIEPLPKGFDIAGLTPLGIAEDGTVTGSKFQMIDGEVIPLDLERPTLGRNERGNIDLRFPGRPDDGVIQRLTATGFKFNQKEKTWYAGDTAEARALAEELAGSSLPPAREDSKSAQAKPSRQRIRNILNDIRQAGGIKLQSLIDALDRNEVMGPSGRGNRYLRVTGGKGKGFGLDQMASMMLEQGWSVPVDLNGEADANGFAQLLRDAINGDLPVHPDNADQATAVALANELDRVAQLSDDELEMQSLLSQAELMEFVQAPLEGLTADLFEVLDLADYTDLQSAISNALTQRDKIIEEIEHGPDHRETAAGRPGDTEDVQQAGAVATGEEEGGTTADRQEAGADAAISGNQTSLEVTPLSEVPQDQVAPDLDADRAAADPRTSLPSLDDFSKLFDEMTEQKTAKGRDLFTVDQLKEFDRLGIGVSGVTSNYKTEALQQLEFQKEQQADLSNNDYDDKVQAEYDRIAREQAKVFESGNGAIRKLGKNFEVELRDGRTKNFKTLDDAKRGLMLGWEATPREQGAAAFAADVKRMAPADLDTKGKTEWYQGYDRASLDAPLPEEKPRTEVVSKSGEEQVKLFATPPVFGQKPQTRGKSVGTGDLLDNFTSTESVQPDMFSGSILDGAPGLNIIKTPSGKFTFAGKVPNDLRYKNADGSVPSDEVIKEISQSSNPAMVMKLRNVATRNYGSREEAEQAAKDAGYRVQQPASSSPSVEDSKAAIRAILAAAKQPVDDGVVSEEQEQYGDETYQLLRPHILNLWKNAYSGGDLAQVVPTFIKSLLADFGADIKPYAETFYKEILNGDILVSGGDTNVNHQSGSTDLERDSELRPADQVGKGAVQSGGFGSTAGSIRQGGSQPEGAADSADGAAGISGREAAVTGEGRDSTVQGAVVGVDGQRPAGSELNQRSSDFDDRGASFDPVATDAVSQAAEAGLTASERQERQRLAQKLPVIAGDLENIVATLPVLFPGQTDDVKFAEDRFAKPDGTGVLFTNGTGTGKTFSGLGIIKRLERQGKTNILIVAPNAEVINGWVLSGRKLLLDITRLEDTKDAGKGIVVTTFANFGANAALAKRNWDLVVVDEAQYLNSSKDGGDTKAINALRAITLHPDGGWQRAQMLHEKLYANYQAAFDKKSTATDTQKTALAQQWNDTQKAVRAQVAATAPVDRTRVVFLSATPFAYHKNIDYANGYLFDYNEGQSKDETSRGYNSGSNYERFLMTHFGYRMRNNKLTEPPAEVDQGLMERQFNSWLKKRGVLSSRMLAVEHDYDRKFVLAESAIGRKIDEGLNLLRDREEYRPLADYVTRRFDYLHRRYLLEAIKAKEVIPILKQHVALGRKVVVFHDYNQGGGMNPFDLRGLIGNTEEVRVGYGPTERMVKLGDLAQKFVNERADLVDLPFKSYGSALTTLKAAFPDLLTVNGTNSKKVNREAIERFQTDNNGDNLIVVQADKGKEGISLHDTTGVHPRVLINLGLPGKPTMAIQQEGRIYRTGQASNAMFRYMNTGTNWERYAFATTLARRASTAENLAMGEEARMLLDAYIEAYQDSDSWTPGHEGEGTGGKERDRAANSALTEWDRAMSFYFGQRKGRQNDIGKDYFATPEPLGLKMVEWADVLPGEAVLEPSGGHGAIARWFPDLAKRRAIEPSFELASKLALVFDGDIVQGTFEDHHTINKYDAIVMNPPFGSGGKTAIDHLDKAAQHLKDNGRIVALIPTGPAADKKFEKWLYDEKVEKVEPLGKAGDNVTVWAGDGATVRLSMPEIRTMGRGGVLGDTKVKINRISGSYAFVKPEGWPQFSIEASRLQNIEPTGPREKRISNPLNLTAEIKLPTVTFERAGTSVATRIVVLDKGDVQGGIQRDYSRAETAKDFFERIKDSSIPGRTHASQPNNEVDPVKAADVQPDGGIVPQAQQTDDFTLASFKHTQTGETMYVATLNKRDAALYSRALSLVKKNKGYYSKYTKNGAIAGFLFKDEADRSRFLQAMQPDAVRDPLAGYAVAENVVTAGIVKEADHAQYSLFDQADQKGADRVSAGVRQAAVQWYANQALPGSVRNITNEVGFTQTGTFTATTGTVRTAADAARIFAPLADKPKENLMMLVLDRSGKPLAVLDVSTGSSNQSIVHPKQVIGAALNVPGAASVWIAHNHPTGDPTFSPEDRTIDTRLRDVAGGSGLDVAGFMAIGQDGDFYETNYYRGAASEAGKQQRKIPVLDQTYLQRTDRNGERITDPAQITDSLLDSLGMQGKDGVLLLDGKNRIVATVAMPLAEMERLRTKSQDSGSGLLMKLLARTNSAAMLVVTTHSIAQSHNAIANMAKFGELFGVRVLDGITAEGSSTSRIGSVPMGAGSTFFSLASALESYTGMQAAELRKEFGDRIQVIQTPDQMPDVATADAEAMGVKPWQIEAFVHNGQVWLVAENIRSMSRARVLAFGHELAHLGQDEKVVDLAEAWFKATESDASEGFKKAAHNLLQEEAAKRKLDMNRPEHYREAVREATARLAEDMAKNGVKPGLIQKIVNQLRQLLRQMYGKLRVTDQELAGAVAEMLRIGEKKLGDSSNPDIRFSLRDDIAKAVEQIDWQQVIDATRNNWLQTLNPLDWSRSWSFMQDALPENVKAAFGWFFMSPVFQAERDPAKRPFVEAGETRELNRMQIMLDFLGFNPGQEDKRSAAKKTWDFVTSWQNGQVSTDWEDLNQRMFALTKAQKRAFDFLVAEGDAMGSEYDSLAQARLNPRIAKQAGMDQAVFDLYRAVRRHIEHVREVRIKQMDAMLREVPDMTDKEREKHIADYRNSDRQVRGWMTRHHGEGREQVAVYHLFDAEELNDSWVTTPLLDKDGEPAGDQFFLPFYPGSRAMQAMEQRIKEGWTEAKAKITTTAKGHVVVTINGDSSGAMEDIQVAIDEELKDEQVRVMAYMRRFQTRRGAEKHAEKVRADYKGAMPRNYSAARSYQTEVQTVDMLTEDLFQAMKGDMAIEAALKESLKKALKRGELDKDKYEELNDQLVQDTAEVLLSRAAGRYQIRRSPYLIEGYDTEGVMSLYQDYMMGVAGMLSKAQYAMQQYENLRQAKAQVKPWAVGFVFDSLRNMGLGDRISGDIRSFASLWLMGFKISSALINATQPYTMGIAELYRQLPEDGKQSASRLILKAQKDVLTSKNLKNDERQIFDTAVYKQQEMQTALGELSGHNEGTYTKAGRTLQALTGKALALFQNVEVLNRKSVILAGYRAFRSKELAAGALDEAALRKAMEINGKVNFEMGRHNLPGWARGAVGRTFYSLQSFTWNSLNWIFNRLTSGERRDQIALLRYAGVLALLGGMSALPGGDELDKLYRKLRGRSLKLDFQDWTKRQTDRFGTLGEMANAFAWHGLLSAGGYGVQASNAIRLQIPVVSQWLADRSALEAASGVPGALVGKVQTAAMYLQRGYYYRAAESASPEFVAGWLRAIRQYREGATTSHGKKVFDEQGQQIRYSSGDVFKRGLGFQPYGQSKRGELAEQMRKIQTHWNSERAELLDELRGSSGKSRDKVLKKLIEFNQKLSESQAAGLVQPITATTVRNGLTYRPNQRQSRWLQQYSD